MNTELGRSASGLSAVEVDLLRAVQECTEDSDGPYAPSTDVLEEVDARTGLGPRYAYRIMADLTADWVRHLPLLEGDGNFGSVAGDQCADARYTSVRLTRVGELALASQRGTIGPLPLDLIEGSLYRGGALPPFDPALTLRALLTDGHSPGLPKTPTGTITTDPTERFRRNGRWLQRYQLGSVIRTRRNSHELLLTEPPHLIGTNTIITSLQDRLAQASHRPAHDDYSPSGSPTLNTPESVPIRDVQHLISGPAGTQVVLHLRKDVKTIDAVDWIRSIWPVTVYTDCLPDEEIYYRFEPWRNANKSGVEALDKLLHPIDTIQD